MRAAQIAARDAERRFPVRVRIAVPPEGLGSRLDQIIAARCELRCPWVDLNPIEYTRRRGDALGVCFLDATIVSAFVARCCAM
jgi:hypothetical protein